MKVIAACLVIASAAPVLHALDPPPPVFRLNIRTQESGPESPGTTRNYALVVQSGSRGKINASRRIPYYSSTGAAKELHTVALGSIIECSLREAEAGVRLDCSFESSYVAPKQPVQHRPIGFPPELHSRQVHTTAVIPLGPEKVIGVFMSR